MIKVDVDWDRVDLNRPVHDISVELGVCGATVRRQQKKMGVRSTERRAPIRNLVDWSSVDLGQRPDTVIASELGVTAGAVQQQRNKRKISPFVPDLLSQWIDLPLGQMPDAVLGRQVGVQSNHVRRYREKLGISLFPGRLLSQEGRPLKSQWEAKYDAYLHENKIWHEHEVSFPELGVVVDFQLDDHFVEVAGMMREEYYRNRVEEKKKKYLSLSMDVIWIEPDYIELLYKDCSLSLRYTEFAQFHCVDCGVESPNLVKGRCKKCYETYNRSTRVVCRICPTCLIAFETYKAHPADHCNRLCYHTNEIDYSRLSSIWGSVDWSKTNSILMDELDVSLATIKKARRSHGQPYRKKIDWPNVDWSRPNKEIATMLNMDYRHVWQMRRRYSK